MMNLLHAIPAVSYGQICLAAGVATFVMLVTAALRSRAN